MHESVVTVEINPNLRLPGGTTVVDLTEDVFGGQVEAGVQVVVFERRSGLTGRAWVEDVDLSDGAVTLKVDWGSLRVPSSVTRSGNGWNARNLSVQSPSAAVRLA